MNSFTVASRLIKEIINDKRTVALLFVAPVLVLYLLNVILTSTTSAPNIGTVGGDKILIDTLRKNAEVKVYSNEKKALDALKDGECDAYVIVNPPNNIKIKVEGGDPSISGTSINAITKSLTKYIEKKSPAGFRSIKPDIDYLYGSKNMSMFDTMAPMLMGFFIFFFVFLLAGVSFLRERISGTLERILATPLRRHEIVLGYFFGFGAFVALQTLIIQLVIIYGFGIESQGNFWLVLLVNLILASGSLSLGTLLSSFARNEFQLFQFIPIIIVPQILFSGLFDLREAPSWVNVLSQVFPMTYGAGSLRDIMIRGYGIDRVGINILILTGYALLFLILNSVALKKYRKL